MKKLSVLLFIATFLSVGAFAQSKSDKMYDVFDNRDGVTNFSFSKSMVGAVNLDVGDDDDEQKVTGDLNQVRFMSYNPKKGDMTGSEFIRKAVGLLPSAYKKYESDDDEDAEIWLLGNKKKYSECHMFFKSDSEDGLHFVVSFYGDFNVNDLDGLKAMGEGYSD